MDTRLAFPATKSHIANFKSMYTISSLLSFVANRPCTGLYGEAPPESDTFFRLQVYKMVGILKVEVYKMVGKSVVSQRVVNK